MATPAVAVWVLLLSVPADPSVKVTVSVKLTSVLSAASCAVTMGCVVKAEPLTDPAGAVVKATVVAVMLSVVPVLLVMAALAPLIWVPVPEMVRSVSPTMERIRVWFSLRVGSLAR